MKRRALALVGLVAVAGCLQRPDPDATNPAAPAAAHYRLAGTDTCPLVPITGVAASSTRNSYFPASHTIDGKPSTAWAPLATDATPSLVFSLAELVTLEDLQIKSSHITPNANPIRVDVAVSTDGGATYTTVVTNLTPTPATLASLTLPPVNADHVKLTFNTSNLYVCEVRFTGCPVATPTPTPSGSGTPTPTPSGSVTPTPSPSASTTPTPTPSASATVTPTPTPTGSPTPTPSPTATPDCCDTTGGGFVLGNPNGGQVNANEISFGFVAHHIGANNSIIQGQIEVNDHRPGGPTFHGDVTTITCVGNTVTFTGNLTGNAGTYSCTVTDNGEPGDTDLFSFSTSGGYSISGDLGGAQPGGGNIQVTSCSTQ